uniref:Uncharacterized protein n=1 Tax=Arundo donax TaxID=35708 RepID=A0A0A9FIX8_ARUDO
MMLFPAFVFLFILYPMQSKNQDLFEVNRDHFCCSW